MKEFVFTKDDIKSFTKDIKKLKIEGHSKEQFKQVFYEGKPSQYLISSYGRIISTRYRGVAGRIHELKPKVTQNGYMNLTLCFGKKHVMCLVHRLVAIAFIKNPKNKPEVNHKDGIKKHNYAWNLEWATRKENDEHAILNNLKHFHSGEDVTTHVFSEKDIRKVCKHLVENKLTMKQISEKTGVYYDIVRSVKDHRTWVSVSNEYDFSHYNGGKKKKDIDKKDAAIRKACEMLESNKYTIKQISEKTGISYGMVIKILNGESHTRISKDYDLSKYISKSPRNKNRK